MDIIKSSKNERIKFLKTLFTKKGREVSQKFVVEGYNSIKDIPNFYDIDSVYIRKDCIDKFYNFALNRTKEVLILEESIFDAISETTSPSGIIAVCSFIKTTKRLDNRVLILDTISDPGNLGSILRSCCAFGINDVIAINCVDLYNSKVVRASMSAIFKIKYLELNYEEALIMLEGYEIIALSMGGKNILDFSFKDKTAMVIGNESKGVSNELLEKAHYHVSIPMSGNMESLNAAIAGSIAMFVLSNIK